MLKQFQIATGVCAVLAVLFAGLWVGARGDVSRLQDELQSQNDSFNPVGDERKKATPEKKRDLDLPSADEALRDENKKLRRQVTALENRNRELLAELDHLRTELDRVQNDPRLSHNNSNSNGDPSYPPNGGTATGSEDEEIASSGTWESDGSAEMKELASAVGLNEKETEDVHQMIMEGQKEFEEAMLRLQKAGGDFEEMERIGEELSRKIQERIENYLPADKREKFRRYIEQQEAESE